MELELALAAKGRAGRAGGATPLEGGGALWALSGTLGTGSSSSSWVCACACALPAPWHTPPGASPGNVPAPAPPPPDAPAPTPPMPDGRSAPPSWHSIADSCAVSVGGS
ncbi:hypothetical protein FOA52_011290 [Chlamydomonas sp. UWO 241]|nr:hypothetical protein FOA52_011290 [Chlamydomonas sp. UWO 241]